MSYAVDLSDLAAYLHTYLEVDAVEDYGPNGIQVEGRASVSKIVTGVSSCQELFVRAAEAGADAILVHHGLFWSGMPYALTGVQYRRVAELIRRNISLLAYHLPLDRHAEVGNNAVAATALGLRDLEPFGIHNGVPIGYAGRYEAPLPIPIETFVERCRHLYDREPLRLGRGPDLVSRVGIVSGGAQKEVYQAIDAELDVFVTGEVSEWVTNLTREAGIHYLSAGHYATETLGVQALGRHLGERFGVETEFIDVPNPV